MSWVAAAMAVADYAKRQKQKEAEKRQIQADIYGQSAADLGVRSYHKSAMASQEADQLTQPDQLGMLQQYLQGVQKSDADKLKYQQGAQDAAAKEKAKAAGEAYTAPYRPSARDPWEDLAYRR